MLKLHQKIQLNEEKQFELRSNDFLRPALKQIGDSVYDIKNHYMSKGGINVVPNKGIYHLAEIRDTLLRHLEDDSFLYKNNIVTGSTIEQTDDYGQRLSSLVVLMNSLALAMDIEISPRPSDVQCDILLAICGQPVTVLTLVDGDKDSVHVMKYNTSVARGVTQTVLKFTNERLNVVFGILRRQDIETADTFRSSISTIATKASLFVPTRSLTTSPTKYKNIVTSIWAGISQTTSVISRDDRVDIDYLRFLTEDQCTILLENINKSNVEVTVQTYTGATTIMLEVAKRLSRLGNTILVCRSQEEKEKLRLVYKETYVPDDLWRIDTSKYKHLVDETGLVLAGSNAHTWRIMSDLNDMLQLVTSVQKLQQETEFKEQLIVVLGQLEKRRRLDYLSYLKLYHVKMYIYGLLSEASEDTHLQKKLHYFGSTEESEDSYIADLAVGGLQSIRNRAEDLVSQDNQYPYQPTGKGFTGHINSFPVLKSVHLNTSGWQSLTKSENETGLKEDFTTKITLQDTSFGFLDNLPLRNKLMKLEKKSLNQDEEVRKNPTELAEWKTKADLLVLELPPIIINRHITNITGEEVTLEAMDETHVIRRSTAQTSRSSSSQSLVHLLRKFQHGRLQKRNFRDRLGKAIIEDSTSLSNLEVTSGRLEIIFGPVYILGKVDQSGSYPVSCPAMTLNKKRVFSELFVFGSEDEYLFNSQPDRLGFWIREEIKNVNTKENFKYYFGTCSMSIPLPRPPITLTTPCYWETNSQLQGKERYPGLLPLLEMALEKEGDLDSQGWVSGWSGSGWSVALTDCSTHRDCYCLLVFAEGEVKGQCQSTTPSDTHGTVVWKLGLIVDIGRGRIAFLDITNGKVLHKLDVKFRQSLYPMFGVCTRPDRYLINMRLISGHDIIITDAKKDLITEALFSS